MLIKMPIFLNDETIFDRKTGALKDGVDVDCEKAYKHLSQAALMENVNAMYKLGDMFYHRNHVKEDKDAAFYWYEEANNHTCYE
jgi:TPR repeat protein